MSCLNEVNLIGYTGDAPELRYTAGNIAVANFSVATSKSFVDSRGNQRDETEWHRINVWGPLAELVSKYGYKGQRMYIKGELKTRKWTDKQNIDRYTTEIKATQVIFLSKNNETEDATIYSSNTVPQKSYNSRAAAAESAMGNAGPQQAAKAVDNLMDSLADEDLPF